MPSDTNFMKAGNLGKLCELIDKDGLAALVEPYAIYTSSRGRRRLYCYQVSEPKGWRSVDPAQIAAVRIRDEKFSPRPDYDPFDKSQFPMMHFSIPTLDGRQRWADKPSTDKTAGFLRPHIE